MLTIDKIKERLGDRNLTEVARRAGLTYWQVYNMANGKTLQPSYEVVKALSDYLDDEHKKEEE